MHTRKHQLLLRSLPCLLALTLSSHAESALMGVEPIIDELVYTVDAAAPLTLLLSKCRYPAEDGHLDALLWVDGPGDRAPEGALTLRLLAADQVLTTESLDPLPGGRIFFSMRIPESLVGKAGVLEVIWEDADGGEKARAAAAFRVADAANPPRSGRIRLSIPNGAGVRGQAVPVSVGVPFPRGALNDANRVRLLSRDGTEHPLQTKGTSRWSRFGSIKWIRCDFTASLDGGPSEWFLAYGPDRFRNQGGAILSVQPRQGLPPLVENGPLRFGDGIAFDPGDGGGFRTVITPEGLDGAFVEHENGIRYRPSREDAWEIEEQGAERVLLRRQGWYVASELGTPPAKSGKAARFCRYNTRLALHRGSPLVRIVHTWIYTGDAYADRIRNMGWRFDLAGAQPGGFLDTFDRAAVRWLPAKSLLQYDFEHFQCSGGDSADAHGSRSPGVARASLPGIQLLLGVKDFWQNFPNELEFADGALYAHQWPRHGRPALHPTRIEDGLRLWFAHEGELLDFALPLAWTQDPDFFHAAPARNRSPYQLRHRRETINAQGIAKTEEIWLWFGPDSAESDGVRLMNGLNEATVSASVDPAWVAASGALYEIHPRDPARFPGEEHAYELAALAPMKWVERIRFYGKWIWGDMTWMPDLDSRGFGLYRGFRKAHQGWPYCWIPYARSGDPRFRRFADAATRHMSDVVFCHYSDSRVSGSFDDGSPRTRGFSIRYRVPWATPTINPSSRGYSEKVDYLLHSHYLTGYERAWDVLLDWSELTKHEGWNNWGNQLDDRKNFTTPLADDGDRGSVTLLKAYLETYEALFDPWFLAAAHQIARAHREALEMDPSFAQRRIFWQPGAREFLRFTGCEDYAAFYRAYAKAWTTPFDDGTTGWSRMAPVIEPAAFGWTFFRDPYYRRRTLGMVQEFLNWTYTYDGEPDHHRGRRVTGGFAHHLPYLLHEFPFALHALADAPDNLEPLPKGFFQVPGRDDIEKIEIAGQRGMRHHYRIALKKLPGRPLPLRLQVQRAGVAGFRFRLIEPSGADVLNGVLTNALPWSVSIPPEAAPGVYRLQVEGESLGQGKKVDGLFLPVAMPEIPEVWEIGESRNVGKTLWGFGAHYWFQVPKGVENFWLEFHNTAQGKAPRISVYNPDGDRIWDFQFLATPTTEESIRIDLAVPPEHAGKLWNVAFGGIGQGLTLDPKIPPLLAVDPQKWFNPLP